MRALAVLLVVVAHAGLGSVVPGGSGVTIFFAISGFIITYTVLREREKTSAFNLRGFYVRRALKLFPPFLLLVVIPTVIYSFFGRIAWPQFASQLLFSYNWVYMNGGKQVLPGSEVVWSLAIEEQFYIAFALIWIFLVRKRSYLKYLILGGLILAILSLAIRIVIVFATSGDPHLRVYYGTDTRMDGIAIGIVAAAIFFCLTHNVNWSGEPRKFPRVESCLRSGWIPLVALVLYVLSLVLRDDSFRETLRYSMQAVGASLFMLWGLMRRDGRLRHGVQFVSELPIVRVIGLASYSIYLSHLTLDHVLEPVFASVPSWLRIIFLSIAGTVFGVLVWYIVERPIERWKRSTQSRARNR